MVVGGEASLQARPEHTAERSALPAFVRVERNGQFI